MQKWIHRISFILILTFMPIMAAHADNYDIRMSDNAAEIDVGASSLHYKETASGLALDSETGWMPDVNVGMGFLAKPNATIGNLYFHLDGGGAFGNTNYNGALCNTLTDVCTPYQSTTHDEIYNISGKIGRAFELGKIAMLTPFADVGYRYWDRQLTGIGGYTEDYSHGDVMGGALLQFSPIKRWVFSLSGEAGTTFSPSMNTGGDTYTLKDRTIWEAAGKLGYRLTERVELTGTVDYTDFRYGASAPVDGYYEPDSYSRQLTTLIGLSYHFGTYKE
jgi:hypothetical protein